jgi:hypothetical protein
MKIAFVCSGKNSTPFSEYVPLAQYFNSKGINTFFFLEKDASHQIVQTLKKGNQTYYLGKDKNKVLNHPPQKKVNGKEKESNSLKRYIPGFVLRLKRVLLYKAQKNNLAYYTTCSETVINQEKPDCIILYGDRNKGAVPPAIKLARAQKIPLVVLQVATNTKSFLLHSRRENKDYSDQFFLNKMLKRKYPNQWITEKGKEYSFYSWYDTLALSKFGMLPKTPWFEGESWADKNLILSKQVLIDSKAEGAKGDNAVVVGQYSHDLLFENFSKKEIVKKEICGKYFNGSNKSIIVFAFPQFAEHNLMTKNEALKEIKYISDCINHSDVNVLVSLHPKMDYEDYKQFENSNLMIAKDERLSYILPIGDIFITAFESTISWALLCGIVPVFLDFYGLGFSLDKFQGSISFKEKPKFEKEIKEVINNIELYKSNLNQNRDLLPPFDGKSGERILNEIKELVGNV